MVVKDANGETYVGNISVLPSEKKCVFNEMSKCVMLISMANIQYVRIFDVN